MAIHVNCYICEKELDEPGGLLFDLPNVGQVNKTHICKKCWDDVVDAIGALWNDRQNECSCYTHCECDSYGS